MSELVRGAADKFSDLLSAAAKLPGVRIKRDDFLRHVLADKCADEQLTRAIAETPGAAGVSLEALNKAAGESINYEAVKATALSAAAGAPGFLAMAATLPADMAQYLGHMLRVSQKLAYLYGWPDLYALSDEIDDSAKVIYTLFVGGMHGSPAANEALARIATLLAQHGSKRLPKEAFTDEVLLTLVMKVANLLGTQLTKRWVARGAAKFVPVLGAVVSGGTTLASFVPMSHRLRVQLAGLDLARSPGEDSSYA